MASLGDLLSTLSPDPHAKGKQFEKICKWYLQNEPLYKFKLKKVWLWKEWPDRWGIDAGIDLIALDVDGKYWAIQAKGYAEHNRITKSDVDTFLSESSREAVSFRLIISTTNNIGNTAYKTIQAQEKPVHLVLHHDLSTSDIDWPDSISAILPTPPKKKKPRKHQLEAIQAVEKGFKEYDRGQLILACGTGKTLTALWLTERLAAQKTLILVPSLSLLKQTLLEWSNNCSSPFDYLAVCSDKTVAVRGGDETVQSTIEIGVPVTTDVQQIVNFLSRDKDNKPSYVFSTYQSSECIKRAHQLSASSFDLIIADEAHRCTGNIDKLFATVLDSESIRGHKRLFMTATPRYFTGRLISKAKDADDEIASMDDEKVFGPVFHKLMFGAAIKQNLLTDYHVVVIGVSSKETKRMVEQGLFVRTQEGLKSDARTLASTIGLAKAIKEYNLKKVITFHSSIKKARNFTSVRAIDSLPKVINSMDIDARPAGDLWTNHISGKMPAGKRADLLTALGQLKNEEIGVISNCACLGEGVDVPTLDGIAFIDPRRSMVDIIQAVGRVIRKSEDKSIGTVVVSVLLEEGDDPDAVVNQSVFKPVWQVIKALKAHDDVLAEELDALRYKLSRRQFQSHQNTMPDKISIVLHHLIDKAFEESLFAQLIKSTTEKPKLSIDQILEWADSYNKRNNEWPSKDSGRVYESPEETWSIIDGALFKGMRGLPGGNSLALLLQKERGRRHLLNQPHYSTEQVIKWADSYYRKNGKWPIKRSGIIDQEPSMTWSRIDELLSKGFRGLPGGISLAKLLEKERGVVNKSNLPPICIESVLKWADSHFKRTGNWPSLSSGQILEAPDISWVNINNYLIRGNRGFPGGQTLAQVLEEKRGCKNRIKLRQFQIPEILKWCDAYYQRSGKWPKRTSGVVEEASDVTWANVDRALRSGNRGLPAGNSLLKMLSEKRGAELPKSYLKRWVRNKGDLSVPKILKWADSYFEKHGKWPSMFSGKIDESLGDTWQNINSALLSGGRGLPSGSSLAKLLRDKRGKKGKSQKPHLSIDMILEWADNYHKKYGKWPTTFSGKVDDAPDEKWTAIHEALRAGYRGLPKGYSLAKLFLEKRGVISKWHKPKLSHKQIIQWAKAYFKDNGEWPTARSGPVSDTAGENWQNISNSLSKGQRGLPKGGSLAKLLAKYKK